MAANIIDEMLKEFPDIEKGWKEMEERFKKDPAEREMLSLKYQQMLERERLKENLPEPEFTKSKKAETTYKVTSKVTSKVASKVSEDLEEAAIQFATDTETGMVDVVKQSSFLWGAIYHKQQMMAKAVNGTAMPNDAELWLESQSDLKEFAEGEEVKVIVIKKDEL